MAGKATLRADPQPLQSLLRRLARTLGDMSCDLKNAGFQPLHLLQLRGLGRDEAQDEVLVPGEETQRLEAAGP